MSETWEIWGADPEHVENLAPKLQERKSNMALTVSTDYTIKDAQARLEALFKKGSAKFTEETERAASLTTTAYLCHMVAVSRGWWHEKDGVTFKKRNIGEMIALIHSEVSEGFEGLRQDKVSDHLPFYSMFAEEMADVFIRLGDLCFAMQTPLQDAVFEKLEYNLIRKDHSIEAREAPGGKKV